MQPARDDHSSGSSSDSIVIPPSPEQDAKKIIFRRPKPATAENSHPTTSYGVRDAPIHSMKAGPPCQVKHFEMDAEVVT